MDFWRVLVVCVLLTLTINILVRLPCSIALFDWWHDEHFGRLLSEKTRNKYSGSEPISTRAVRVLIQWEKHLSRIAYVEEARMTQSRRMLVLRAVVEDYIR